jgi:predicted acetyltransferase
MFFMQLEDTWLRDGELVLEPIEVAPHPVHCVPTHFFKMIHADSRQEIGRVNLRIGSGPHIERYAGHVGYSVAPAHRGHRFASRALKLLLPLARGLQINPLWVTCDPENIPSRRACELAGGMLVEIVDVPTTCVIHQSGHPRKCRYRFTP